MALAAHRRAALPPPELVRDDGTMEKTLARAVSGRPRDWR